MTSFVDDMDPVKKALPVVIAVCVAIVLVGAVYFLAEYRAGTPKAAPASLQAFQPVGATPEPLEANGIEGILTQQGFLVTNLDGKARGLGLMQGDLVSTISGRPVTNQLDLKGLTAGVDIKAQRGGQPLEMKIGNAAAFKAADVRTISARGLTGQLTPEGLWVTSAQGDSAIWGLRSGDLVRTVDGHSLTVRRDATTRLRMLSGRMGFVFEIVRDGSRLFLPYNSSVNGQTGASPMVIPAMPAAAAGLGPGFGGGRQPACAGVACPNCGTFHQPGMHRGACVRCGNALPAQAMATPQFGAGVAAQAAPATPCGQPPRRFNEGWAGGFARGFPGGGG